MPDVMLFCLCLWSLSGVFCEFVSVTEGESVTLSMNLTEHQRKQGISWTFGAQRYLIAQIIGGNPHVRIYDDQANGRFRGRLKMDHIESLTITKTRITDSGLYEVINTSTDAKLKIFKMTVHAHLPVPVITNSLSLEGSSSSKCVLMCSVMNVSHGSLSWYKGKSLLSSISGSEHISSISLHLECLDDSYTCVIKNPTKNQTQHLTTDVCHKCSGLCSCGFTVAVIRLVLSALVGVATVAAIVSDIRSRRKGRKMRSKQKKMGSDS